MINWLKKGIRQPMNRAIGRTAVTTVAVLLFSCAIGKPPRWDYGSAGRPAEYKRYPRNIAVDYVTRFRRLAYRKVDHPIKDFLTDEQRQWVGKNGQPEYRRRVFRSREGERVDEWLYLKKNKLVQFVQGHIVYQGEATELERTMLRLGYPQIVTVGQVEPGVERLTFVYKRPLDLEREVFSFANGRLVFRQTQR